MDPGAAHRLHTRSAATGVHPKGMRERVGDLTSENTLSLGHLIIHFNPLQGFVLNQFASKCMSLNIPQGTHAQNLRLMCGFVKEIITEN